MPVLLKLGVIVLWVRQDKSVTVDPEGAIPPSTITSTCEPFRDIVDRFVARHR
jgi:hypothetical protein